MGFYAMRILRILLILLFHLFFSKCLNAYSFATTFEVHIVNGLPNNTNSLKLRCQSKDDDFGYHTLLVGQEFYWKFRVNFFETTLYFCHFYWKSEDTSFDVFEAEHGYPDCDVSKEVSKCYWLVKDDGFYNSIYKADPNSPDWKKLKSW
ncbi:hypothetical protein LguiA_030049 [Lonicera macranthoides]